MITLRKGTDISTLLIFVFLLVQGTAQESVGLHLSNYLPATSVQLNPALAVDARTRLDIHLIGASAFMRNDHSFLAKEGPGLMDLLRGESGEATENLDGGSRKAYVDVSIDGPGFALVKGRSSFVLSSRFRTTAFAKGVPFELARFIHNGFAYAPQQESQFVLDDLNASGLSWGEVGFTYGRMLKVTSEEHINAAVSVKRLFGVGMASLQLRNTSYEVGSGDLALDNFGGGYSFGAQDQVRPNGWGVDLGLVYRKVIDGSDDYVPFSESSGCQKSRYRYELGVSLLDVGSMTFYDDAVTVRHSGASGDWEEFLDFNPESLEELEAELANQFEADQNSHEREEIAKISLPTALSIQFDYDFDKGLHLGSVLQQNLRGSNPNNLRRANLLSLVPRYERTFFEFSIPMTFYEYERVVMGAALRLYMITIGSDDLFAVATGADLYGADIYCSVRIPLYKTFACKPGKKSSRNSSIAPCWGQ